MQANFKLKSHFKRNMIKKSTEEYKKQGLNLKTTEYLYVGMEDVGN